MSTINDEKNFYKQNFKFRFNNDAAIEFIDIDDSEDDNTKDINHKSLIKQIKKFYKKDFNNSIVHIEIPIYATKVLRKPKFYNKCLNKNKRIKNISKVVADEIVSEVKVSEGNKENNLLKDCTNIEINRLDNKELVKETVQVLNIQRKESVEIKKSKKIHRKRIFSFLENREKIENMDKYISFREQWQNELCQITRGSRHSFMKENFPNMYKDIRNYYSFIKQNRERKKNEIYSVQKDKLNNFNSKKYFLNDIQPNKITNENFPKIVWKIKNETDKNIESNFIFHIEFLRLIEKVWPFGKFKYKEEIVLEFVMINEYKFHKIYEEIKNCHVDFKNFFISTIEFN